MSDETNSPKVRTPSINTNTYVSVGLLVAILGGFWAVINTIYSAKFELASNQVALATKVDSNQTTIASKVDNLTLRMDKFEKFQETWGLQDMFKWSVHLQRDNDGSQGSVKLRVPEP